MVAKGGEADDFYAPLGLEKECSADELKNAYRKLAEKIAEVVESLAQDYAEGMQSCHDAGKIWMQIPAPKRDYIVRQIVGALRAKLQQLGRLVSL